MQEVCSDVPGIGIRQEGIREEWRAGVGRGGSDAAPGPTPSHLEFSRGMITLSGLPHPSRRHAAHLVRRPRIGSYVPTACYLALSMHVTTASRTYRWHFSTI